jgi:hypothetical protein
VGLFVIDAFNDNGVGISNIDIESFGFPLVDGDAKLSMSILLIPTPLSLNASITNKPTYPI